MAKKLFGLIKLIVVLLILTMVVRLGYSLYSNARYPLNYSSSIKKYADEFEVDPYLVAAVISVESGFDHEARSHRDARGLMQIGETTGEWAAEKLEIGNYNQDMLYDPDLNIRIGSWYLNNLSKEFDGNMPVVLAAYNGGSGNVNKWLSDPNYSKDGINLDRIPFAETRAYVEKVMDKKEDYESRYKNIFDNPVEEENVVLAFVNRVKKIVKDIF